MRCVPSFRFRKREQNVTFGAFASCRKVTVDGRFCVFCCQVFSPAPDLLLCWRRGVGGFTHGTEYGRTEPVRRCLGAELRRSEGAVLGDDTAGWG